MVEIKLVKLFSKNWTKTLSVFFFVLLLGAYAYTFAVPPDTKYSAGETLDPNCGPLDPNCSVELTTTESDPIVGAINGLIKADGSGNISAVASGTDIKTINGSSILGSGDITVSGGGSMVYPGSGIAVSTGTAWGTSISGTSSQFVKGDGSLDSNTYVTGTPWTSMGYITDGNTGWDNSYGFITSYTETDPIVGAINGLVKANGGGTISAVVSGTDIKTINGSSILGSGDITISGGGSMVYPGSGIAVSTGTAWGTSISGTSSQFVKADGSLDSSTYLTSSSLSGYVPYTGATGAVTLGANTLSTTSGIITPKIYPASDSTTAIQFNKADGTTNVMNIDTTNGYVGIGTTSPTAMLDIKLSPTIIFSQVFYEDDKGDDSLNDATFSGTYTGASDDSIYVQIDSAGSPDTFSYSDNLGDCPVVNNVPITGSVQSLCLGMSIQFTNITGHSISDVWGYESHEGLAEPIKISDLDDNTYFKFIPSQDIEDVLAIGYQAGPSDIMGVRGSYFLGYQAGYSAESANYVNFFGSQSGYEATKAQGSNFLGYQAGYQASNAETSNFLGVMAGYGATSASNSNFFGLSAGQGAIGASYSNFFGDSAGSRAEKASNSIFIGTSAGFGDTVDNTTNGLSSILIGSFTNTDGHSNSILLGSGTSDAIISNTKANQFMLADSITDVRWGGVEYTLPSSQGSSGQVLTNDGSGGLSWSTVSGSGGLLSDADYNTVGGTDAGLNLVSGAQYNTFLGYQAGMFSASSTNMADYNTAVGTYSLYSNTTGDNNSAIGAQSLYYNTTGYGNTATGLQSLYSNTTGAGNTATGMQSLGSNTEGFSNTATGVQSLSTNTTGSFNIANGVSSLSANTTGSYNSALGSFSISSNTVGNNNSALGYNSLYSSKTGSNGVAFGYESQRYANDTTTSWINYNTSVGYQSLTGSETPSNNIGNYNTVIGYKTLYVNTTGANNSALGYSSLSNNTTGSNNIGIGYQAGMFVNASASPNQTSSNSIYIGYNTQGLLDGDTNEIVIGHEAVGHGSNTAQWGNTDIDNHYLSGNVQFSTYGAGTLTTDASGNITASSDERLKDIQGNFDNNGNALDIINSINPILYKWNDISGFDQTTTYAGFSAQNIQDVIPEAVDTDSRGYLTLSDRPILATTVNAIKELDLKVKEFIEADVTDSNSVKSMFKSFLEDFTNGLEIVFFGEVHTKKLCIDDVCVDKAQLEQLLINSGMTSSGSDSKSTSDTSGDADTGADNSVDNDTEDGAQADAGVQDGAEAVDGDSAMGENGGTTQEEITANDESGTAEEEAGGGEQGGTDTGTVVENN